MSFSTKAEIMHRERLTEEMLRHSKLSAMSVSSTVMAEFIGKAILSTVGSSLWEN